MALVEFANRRGFRFGPHPFTQSNTLCNAINEGLSHVGHIRLSSGVGTNKVISAGGGGKIHWASVQAATFANAASNWRVGIQDVDANGLGDGTFDVHADLVGGTDTITSPGINSTTMESGTKTIADGDLIAVVTIFTAYGGADTIRPVSNLPLGADTGGYPYVAANNVTKQPEAPAIIIEFDDGTIGYFEDYTMPSLISGVAFNSGSTPDEYANIFQVPLAGATNALWAFLGDVDNGETGELILYSDPLGTPTVEATGTVTFSGQAGTGSAFHVAKITEFQFDANTTYAVAYRPTTAGSRTINMFTVPTASSRASLMGGTTFRLGSRTDQTGAFSEDTTTIPMLGMYINKIEASGGGGTRSYSF